MLTLLFLLIYANTSVDYRDEMFEVGGVQKSDVIHARSELLSSIFKVSCISFNASCVDVLESVAVLGCCVCIQYEWASGSAACVDRESERAATMGEHVERAKEGAVTDGAAGENDLYCERGV